MKSQKTPPSQPSAHSTTFGLLASYERLVREWVKEVSWLTVTTTIKAEELTLKFIRQHKLLEEDHRKFIEKQMTIFNTEFFSQHGFCGKRILKGVHDRHDDRWKVRPRGKSRKKSPPSK